MSDDETPDQDVLEDERAEAAAQKAADDLESPPAHGRRVLLQHVTESFPFGVRCSVLSAAAPETSTEDDEHARVPVLELAATMPWGHVVRLHAPLSEIADLLAEAETSLTTARAATWVTS